MIDLQSFLCIQYERSGGFQQFAVSHFALENATEKEKDRALDRLKKLYEQILQDYVEHLVMMAQMDPKAVVQAEVMEVDDGAGGVGTLLRLEETGGLSSALAGGLVEQMEEGEAAEKQWDDGDPTADI